MAREIYSSENPTGFGIKDKADKKAYVTPGICAGMTAVWCLKMSLGLELARTKPGVQEATYLQFAYEQYCKNLGYITEEFLPRARLVVVDGGIWRGDGRATAASVMANGDGHAYFWGYPGHAIGAARRAGSYYVFDPDRGMQELTSRREFTDHLEAGYRAQLPEDGWLLIQVAPDPAQMHLIQPASG